MDETETTKRKLDENSNVEEESGCNGSQPKVSSQELPSTYQANDSNDEEEVISLCRPVLFPMTPILKKIELGDDCSLNGVFLNGCKVARGSTSMLENCMEISLGLPKNKAYCYMNRDISNDDVFSEKFVLGPKLGCGGLGTVHRCFRAADGHPLAVKIIVKQRLSQSNLGESSERQSTLIEREISILKRISDLDHPNIVRLHEVFDRPDRVMLVMELCVEDMLYHLTKRRESFSEIDARGCIKQVLLALNFLHSNNIIHRDLKLENILVSAVEPVDCWSAGVVLFLLLYKQYPFMAKENERKSLLDSILRDRPHIPSKHRPFVSSDATHLVSGLLKKKAQDRLCASGALQHVWFEENRSDSPSSSSGSSGSSTSSSSDSNGNDEDAAN